MFPLKVTLIIVVHTILELIQQHLTVEYRLITGSSVTNFNNLNVSSAISLTVNNNFSVNQDLFIGSGTLILGNKKVTLLGNLVNNGSYTDDNTTGGISLSGTTQQQISGTGAYGTA